MVVAIFILITVKEMLFCHLAQSSFVENSILPLDIDLALFVLDLHMKYTVEVVPLHTYIVSFDSSPYVTSVGRVFAYLYTLADDLAYPSDYETSLLPKVFLSTS